MKSRSLPLGEAVHTWDPVLGRLRRRTEVGEKPALCSDPSSTRGKDGGIERDKGKNLAHHLQHFEVSFSSKTTLEIKKMGIWETVSSALKRLIRQQAVTGHRKKQEN